MKTGENHIRVESKDPLDLELPYGKQTYKRGGMWYTPISGVWQSIWIEQVPNNYIKALKIAQAYDFVKEYPDFLEHHVNKGGTNFSGGQRQRLTIARALVGNPHIIILDDASSALDFATDAKLRKSIRQNLSDATTFIVTQRTNSIRDANKIIVINNGIIEDIGTHTELLERCIVYQEIHYSQNKKETK